MTPFIGVGTSWLVCDVSFNHVFIEQILEQVDQDNV